MFDRQLSWLVSHASSRAMTLTTDLVLQVKERQQGDLYLSLRVNPAQFRAVQVLGEMPGRYGVRAARMPIGPTSIDLSAKFLKI
jgi:hypothetical protein